MRTSLRTLVFFFLALSTISAFSQAPAIFQSGNMGYFTNTDVAAAMTADGIRLKVAAYTANLGFNVVSGSLDMATGNGEVDTAGVVTFLSGSQRMDLRDIQFQSLGANSFVTAAVYQNSVYLGRQAVMTATASPFAPFTLYGPITTGLTYTSYTPLFINEFVTFFQTPDLKTILSTGSTGFLNFSVVTKVSPGVGK